MKEFKGTLDGKDLRFAIVVSRYNDFITGRLKDGAIEALQEHGVPDENIEIFWCPGALELPVLVQRIMTRGVNARHYDGVIVAGCVIRGDTDHYTHVATEAVRGVCEAARQSMVAVGNAILTVENPQQAADRSGEKSMNKGYEAGLVVLEMANLFRALK